MAEKKYYWLKLYENFFEREEVKIIELQTNGEKYIIFYLKLLVKSIPANGRLMFRDCIPYTPDMLSKITNTDVDTVRVAIDLFVNLGLMEKLDDGALFMREVENMVGSETKWAEKKRQQRLSKGRNEDNVPILPTGNSIEDNVLNESPSCPIRDKSIENRDKSIENRDKSIENRDKSLDKERDKENRDKSSLFEKYKQVFTFIDKCGIPMSGLSVEKIISDVEMYGSAEVMKAAEIANDRGKRNYAYLKGILQTRKSEGTDTKIGKKGVKGSGATCGTNAEEVKRLGIGIEI